jgi:predicted dehydrogenase
MRFAVLGEHPDGLNMARALVASGRHEWICHDGLPAATAFAAAHGLQPGSVLDLEEILADPAVELVIVAAASDGRLAQLRRSLQAERHVLCVHPLDDSPDGAYEAAMIQGDTGCVLMPLLTDALHPALSHLADIIASGKLGALRLLEAEMTDTGPVLLDGLAPGRKAALPAWDVLRFLGGEIAEICAYAEQEEPTSDVPLLVAGRFDHGGLFQTTFMPNSTTRTLTIRVVGAHETAVLRFTDRKRDNLGPAVLSKGSVGEEHWDVWDPWPQLVEVFDSVLAAAEKKPTGLISWRSEIRALELDDATRRSIHHRRTSTLEYPEATEEVTFKGTMTLFGCGILWGIIFLAILSRWFPWVGWLIIPILAVFLGMQLLRWFLPDRQP